MSARPHHGWSYSQTPMFCFVSTPAVATRVCGSGNCLGAHLLVHRKGVPAGPASLVPTSECHFIPTVRAINCSLGRFEYENQRLAAIVRLLIRVWCMSVRPLTSFHTMQPKRNRPLLSLWWQLRQRAWRLPFRVDIRSDRACGCCCNCPTGRGAPVSDAFALY